jgi:hypothetical protein
VSADGRLALAEERIAVLDRQISFMVEALSAVLRDSGIDPGRAQAEPLAAIEGGGRRSAPRRPGLHLVPEEER